MRGRVSPRLKRAPRRLSVSSPSVVSQFKPPMNIFLYSGIQAQKVDEDEWLFRERRDCFVVMTERRRVNEERVLASARPLYETNVQYLFTGLRS